MEKKIKNGKILLIAVLLLIAPMVLSAAGNRESGNGAGITLDQEVISLLDQVESGELTIDEAKDKFAALEKEFRIQAEEKEMVMEMLKEVESGEKKAADCEDQLKEQLQTRERTRDRVQSEDKDEDKNKDKGQTRTNAEDGSGDGTGEK